MTFSADRAVYDPLKLIELLSSASRSAYIRRVAQTPTVRRQAGIFLAIRCGVSNNFPEFLYCICIPSHKDLVGDACALDMALFPSSYMHKGPPPVPLDGCRVVRFPIRRLEISRPNVTRKFSQGGGCSLDTNRVGQVLLLGKFDRLSLVNYVEMKRPHLRQGCTRSIS